MKDLFKTLIFVSCLFAVGACGDDTASGDCGNEKVDDGEMCDMSDLDGEDCASATMGASSGGVLGCNADCTFNTSMCTGSGTGGNGGAGG